MYVLKLKRLNFFISYRKNTQEVSDENECNVYNKRNKIKHSTFGKQSYCDVSPTKIEHYNVICLKSFETLTTIKLISVLYIDNGNENLFC